MSNKICVLQNISAGFVGNDLLFYGEHGKGYTCDLDKAEVFTKDEAIKEVQISRGKYLMWEKKYLESIAKGHVDMQYLRRKGGE